MDGEYSQEWAELSLLRRKILVTMLAGLTVFVMVPLVNLLPHRWATAIGLVLFLAWAALLIRFFILLLQHAYWPCPRCGKTFHYKTWLLGRYHNPFAQRCVWFGLPKSVASDPDPSLKHELDRFRSDTALKLGDVQNRPQR